MSLVRYLPAYRGEPMRLKNTLLGSIAALAAIVRGWMSMRTDGPPPPSSLTMTESQPVDASG